MPGLRLARERARIIAAAVLAVAACTAVDDSPTHPTDPRPAARLFPAVGVASFADPGTIAPSARFTVTCRGPHCTFDATGSSDPVDLATYSWTWGNGRSDVKQVPTARTLYTAPGNYPVTLTVSVGGFAPSVITQMIAVPAEPIGSLFVDERRFDCSASTPTCEPGWAFSQTYVNGFAVVEDQSAPKSPPNVSQQNFLPSLPGGSSPATTERSFLGNTSKKTLYVATWIRLSQNFLGHPTSTNKLVHFIINGGNKAYLMARGSGTGVLVPSIGLQGLAAPYFDGASQTATSVNLLPNRTTVPIVRGQWHRYEIILVANSPGIANGSVTVWVDGVKVMDYTGIRYVDDGPAKWAAVQWSPTWGGGGGSITEAFSAEMDHMYISGK